MKDKIYLFFIFTLFFLCSNSHTQVEYFNFQDSVIVLEPISSVDNRGPINLTGNIKVLYVVVGFPDMPHDWPNIPDHPILRRPGTFPNGTLLSDSLDQLNGQIPVDAWFGKGTEHFYDFYSSGQYTATVNFPKDTLNGAVYAFTTDSTFEYWRQKNIQAHPSKLDTNTIYNFKHEMRNQVAKNIYLSNANAFNNVDYINFTYIGISGFQFHERHFAFAHPSGVDITIQGGPTYNIPSGSDAKGFGALTHELLHCVGSAVNHTTFIGLPDRGNDRTPDILDGHHNNTGSYDIMYHSGRILQSQYALYGITPMSSLDLIFFGWIKPDEILTIDNFSTEENFKISDVMYPLTAQQKTNNYFRVVKVLTQNPKEYYLIEYHKGSEFDRNLMNFDEGPSSNGSLNEGLIIWHIKEDFHSINVLHDYYVDIEISVPYNGWNGNPIPDDNYPRNYQRPINFNKQYSGDYDYLDDLNKGYYPDGGRNFWHPIIWWSNLVERSQSMKSDFFSNIPVKGIITDKITSGTRPSTKDMMGNQTYVAVTNIKKIDDYMTCNVYYNYWDGTISQNTTWSGEKIVGKNLIIPENITLTVQPGTNIKFDDGGSLSVAGTLLLNGTANDSIFISSLDDKEGYGIVIPTSESPATANIQMNYCSISDVSVGVEAARDQISVNHSTIDNCSKGINFVNGSGVVVNTYIKNCNYGIYVDGSAPEVSDNIIRNCGYNGLYLISAGGTYLRNAISECGFLDVPTPGAFLALDGSSPILEEEDSGLLALNEIINNSGFGLFASNNSNIFAGSNEEIVTGNSLYNNQKYDAEALYNSTIYAINNWWGDAVPASKQFHVEYDGSIYYEPWLEEPPEGESLHLGFSVDGLESQLNGIALDNTSWKNILIKYIKNKEHIKIKQLVKTLLKNALTNKDFSFLLSSFHHSSISINDSSLISFLESTIASQQNKKFKEILSSFLLENFIKYGKIEKALILINKISNEFPNTSLEVFSMLKKFQINFYHKNDLTASEQDLIILKNSYPNHTYTALAITEFNAKVGNASQRITLPKNIAPKTELILPERFSLHQNYPNPFNPETNISFDLPRIEKVEINIYNTLGQKVRTYNLGNIAAGTHRITWNGENNLGKQVSSGIYTYELKTAEYRQTKKMLLIR